MTLQNPQKNKGFTLIELLVVMAIIGILAAVVFSYLGESRTKSLNAARAAQIREYQKAFNLYYSTSGQYPTYGAGATATMCLGDYADNNCWQNGSSVIERTAIADAIVPQFMGRIPEGETKIFAQGSSPYYEGMTYTHENYGRSYTIRYFMEGSGQNCIITGATGSNVGSDTLCTLVVQP